MKLGSQTNSVHNHLYSRMVIGQPKPVVGMGCTILAWTDRYSGTIKRVEEANRGKQHIVRVFVSHDVREQTIPYAPKHYATYATFPDPRDDGRFDVWQSINGGMWDKVVLNPVSGRWNKSRGNGLRIGERDEYRDPSF